MDSEGHLMRQVACSTACCAALVLSGLSGCSRADREAGHFANLASFDGAWVMRVTAPAHEVASRRYALIIRAEQGAKGEIGVGEQKQTLFEFEGPPAGTESPQFEILLVSDLAQTPTMECRAWGTSRFFYDRGRGKARSSKGPTVFVLDEPALGPDAVVYWGMSLASDEAQWTDGEIQLVTFTAVGSLGANVYVEGSRKFALILKAVE